jgi:VWFA-related protein
MAGGVFLSTLVVLALGYAQGPDFRVTTDLVVVDVQVVSKKTGRTIGALKRENFELYEDGVKQDITFLSQNELPLSIVFLFDLTDSVRPVLKPLAGGALEALQHLKPEDETAVMVYAASAQLLQDFTTDRALTVAAIQKASAMESDEAAFFNEGVFQAASQAAKAKNPNSRRVIVWLTDNVPNVPSEFVRKHWGKSVPEGGLHTEADAIRELFETGTVVSSLLERSAMSDVFLVLNKKNPMFALGRAHNPPGDVYRYTEQTGGQVMKSNKQEVAAKLADLIDQIRTRYSLGYRPPAEQPAAKFCEIKLRVSREVEKREGQVVVKAKRGYYRRGVARTFLPNATGRARLRLHARIPGSGTAHEVVACGARTHACRVHTRVNAWQVSTRVNTAARSYPTCALDKHFLAAGCPIHAGAIAPAEERQSRPDARRDSADLSQGPHNAVVNNGNGLVSAAHGIVQDQLHALQLDFGPHGGVADYFLHHGQLVLRRFQNLAGPGAKLRDLLSALLHRRLRGLQQGFHLGHKRNNLLVQRPGLFVYGHQHTRLDAERDRGDGDKSRHDVEQNSLVHGKAFVGIRFLATRPGSG